MIDITTTATLRPELYEQSLKSLVKYVHGDEGRLLINIDPVGPGSADDVEAVARKYMDNVVVFRPEQANFQLAQLRLWAAVETEFFLNMEDDWEILVDVDLREMVRVMKANPDLALLRLPRWASGEKVTRQWDKRGDRGIPFNGAFFEIPYQMRGNLGFSGMPSLIRTEFLLPMCQYLDPEYDLEKQMKARGRFGRYLFEWRYGVWQKPNEPEAILDIGTPWRKKHKWMKDGKSKHKWTTWQKMEGEPDAK